MSCEKDTNVVNIIQGADAIISMVLTYANLAFFDLTNATIITASFRNADNSILVKTLLAGIAIVAPPANGKITITLTAAETALLKVGRNQNIELQLTVSGQIFIIKQSAVLNVEKRELV